MKRRDFLSALASGAFLAGIGCSTRRTASSAIDLVRLDAIDQARLVSTGEVSPLELVDAAIERIEAINPIINAVVTQAYERARNRARHAPAAGELWGVPYLLKDLNPYKGVRFTRGSNLFRDSIADRQSPYTDKTEAAGLIVLGKTNTPEFGLISTTEPVALGAALNPWNLKHSTGGSSGGSAAAVAARLVPAAQASDGGGSIRIPAAQCGVFGLKPSVGRFPDQFAPNMPWPISIKHAISNTVRDSALLLALTERGADGPLPSVGYITPDRLSRQRIALTVADGAGEAADPQVVSAVEQAGALLTELGHDVVLTKETPLNHPDFVESFLVHWASNAAQLEDLVVARTNRHAADTGLLEPWTLGLAQYYRAQPDDALETALANFRDVQQKVASFFDEFDAWLSPVTATTAPRIGHQAPTQDFATLHERVLRFAAYTPIHNTAGTPAMSVPFAWSDEGLPVGVQLSSKIGNEELLLKLAYQIEEARPWAHKLPPTVSA